MNKNNILGKLFKVDGVVKIDPIISYMGMSTMKLRITPLSPALNKNDWFYLYIYDNPVGNKAQIDEYFGDIIKFSGIEWRDIFDYIMINK